MIIIVRVVVKVLKLQRMLVDNNLIHFIVVLIISFGVAFGVDFILMRIKLRREEEIITQETELIKENVL